MDLKKSKRYNSDKRKQIQKKYIDLLNKLNAFNDEIKADMTTGDEAEILFSSSELLFKIIYLIDQEFGYRYHMGIGIGDVEGLDTEESPTRMYGEAFYRSREAIENSKKRNEKILFQTANSDANELLNTLVSLINHVKDSWTETQKQVIYYMIKNENALQIDAASFFGITPQAISQSLRKAGYDSIRHGERLITKTMTKID